MKKSSIILFSFIFLIMSTGILYGAADYVSEGIAQFKEGNYEEALELFKKAQQGQPGTSTISYYLGVTYKKIGDLKSAEKYFKESLHFVPPVADAYIELIGTLYVSDKLDEARQWIQKAENDKILPGQIAFLKGLVLLKDNDNEGAISSFKKAKELDSTVIQAADFHLAIAYSKERQFDEAGGYLDKVVAADPTSDMASFAKEYQKEIAKGKEAFKEWQFTVGVSYRYDDNVLSKPIDDIPGVDISGEKDSAILNLFRIDYRPNLGSKWFFNAQYNFLSTVYFKNETHNLFINSLSLSPGYNFKDSALSFPLTYTHAILKDKSYMGVLSLKPIYNWIFVPNNIAQAYVGYELRDMMAKIYDPDENRDSNKFLGGFGYVYVFSKGQGMFNLKYEYSYDDTVGSNWVNDGHKINAGLVVPIEEKLSGIITGEAFFQNYKNEHNVFYVHRKDDSYTFGASLVWQALKNFNVNFNYTHTDVTSNIYIYEYKRNMFTTGVEYRF